MAMRVDWVPCELLYWASSQWLVGRASYAAQGAGKRPFGRDKPLIIRNT
jgi:hypothetical protein